MKREDAQNQNVTHTVLGGEPPWTCSDDKMSSSFISLCRLLDIISDPVKMPWVSRERYDTAKEVM